MILNLFAIFFTGSEILKQIVLTVSEGHYIWWNFPFQLCSMPIYLLPAYLITGRKYKWIRDFLIDFSLIGGICVFFDQSGMHYKLPILTAHSYLWHILLIVMAIYFICNEKRQEKRTGYLKEVLLLWILMALAECFNAAFHTLGEINMFYISPFEQMRQVVFRDAVPALGNNGAILLYIGALSFAGLIFHELVNLAAYLTRKKTGSGIG